MFGYILEVQGNLVWCRRALRVHNIIKSRCQLTCDAKINLPDVLFTYSKMGNTSLIQVCKLPFLGNFHIVTGLRISKLATSRFKEIIRILLFVKTCFA